MAMNVQKTGGCIKGIIKDLCSTTWVPQKDKAKLAQKLAEDAKYAAEKAAEDAKRMSEDIVRTETWKMPYGTLTSTTGHLNGKDVRALRCMIDKGGGVTLRKNRATNAIDAYYANCTEKDVKEVATYYGPFLI